MPCRPTAHHSSSKGTLTWCNASRVQGDNRRAANVTKHIGTLLSQVAHLAAHFSGHCSVCPPSVLQYLVIKPTKPDGSPVFLDGSVVTLNVTATTRGG